MKTKVVRAWQMQTAEWGTWITIEIGRAVTAETNTRRTETGKRRE